MTKFIALAAFVAISFLAGCIQDRTSFSVEYVGPYDQIRVKNAVMTYKSRPVGAAAAAAAFRADLSPVRIDELRQWAVKHNFSQWDRGPALKPGGENRRLAVEMDGVSNSTMWSEAVPATRRIQMAAAELGAICRKIREEKTPEQ